MSDLKQIYLNVFLFGILVLLSIVSIQLYIIITDSKDMPHYKDMVILYEICQKKGGSKTNLILKSYGELETPFKSYLLKE